MAIDQAPGISKKENQKVVVKSRDYDGKVVDRGVVELESLKPFRDAFPDAEIITGDMPYKRDWLPGSLQEKDFAPEDRVWLTPNAVRERLSMLFHTNPAFNVRTQEASFKKSITRGGDIMASHSAIRKPISIQELVKTLEQKGFSFARAADNSTVMVVKASLPASENFGWEASRQETITSKSGREEVSKLVAHNPSANAVLPAGKESKTVITVPIEDVVEMYRENWGLEHRVFYDGEHSYKNILFSYIGKFFYYLYQKQGFKEKVDEILASDNISEKRLKMFNLLSELGLTAHPLDHGSFPQEATYNLSTNIGIYLLGEQKEDTFQELRYKLNKNELPTEYFEVNFLKDLQTNADIERVVNSRAGSAFSYDADYRGLIDGQIAPEDMAKLAPEVRSDILDNKGEVEHTFPVGKYTLQEILDCLEEGVKTEVTKRISS